VRVGRPSTSPRRPRASPRSGCTRKTGRSPTPTPTPERRVHAGAAALRADDHPEQPGRLGGHPPTAGPV